MPLQSFNAQTHAKGFSYYFKIANAAGITTATAKTALGSIQLKYEEQPPPSLVRQHGYKGKSLTQHDELEQARSPLASYAMQTVVR
ncbi:MAG: hypothetical protein Altm1KO_27360 [Alteromonas macleodii]